MNLVRNLASHRCGTQPRKSMYTAVSNVRIVRCNSQLTEIEVRIILKHWLEELTAWQRLMERCDTLNELLQDGQYPLDSNWEAEIQLDFDYDDY